ncbi:amino acid ABC transporter ATP-binding protein [Paracoccus shanxieyensis]|uniref:ATP-binding cassette domain-containing protein n=1 Tax=Paracoccus shanxieyensis TaxID=2675752 RepID=A0A6L6IYF8_9RHOB|nr:amino acid ABC transporter ATP-binding protein [Paracoccus shanxieyensis]MTH64120.1 ATP-binding cassette domain-containing protein [Paracoccus shanxieyensis]MTH87264.1 ATP-binding cassette domain-containing protein [Paracoccus shanxieyensis]
MTAPLLQIESLHKSFGPAEVLKGLDLTVNKGERIAILGSSGSGKSTFLRCINFMEVPTSGRVILDGQPIGTPDRRGRLTVREAQLCDLRARVGMIFQQFNLFPHMTVLANVMEGPLSVRREPRAQVEERARHYLARVGLSERVDAYPAQLSGGQQQRVAIARALAMEPEVLLFDEPTSSLDPELVGEVLDVILDLSKEGRTMLLVTHELGFAYHFATRVLFLHQGRIHEEGPPEQVLKAPQQERTREFLSRFTAFGF